MNLPRRLPSTGITPLQRYYASSELLSLPFQLPRFYTCRLILHPCEGGQDPPTFTLPLSLHAMLYDPGDDGYTSRLLLYPLLSPVFRNHRPSHFLFSRLNHFNLSAYGLQISLPTLNLIRYRIKTKARYEMRSVALFRQHFQLLVEVHFRGAPKWLMRKNLLRLKNTDEKR